MMVNALRLLLFVSESNHVIYRDYGFFLSVSCFLKLYLKIYDYNTYTDKISLEDQSKRVLSFGKTIARNILNS
jgi:hypothetical protein